MRRLIVMGVGLSLGLSAALAADIPSLRGDRFKPLDLNRLDPEQNAMIHGILAGSRTSLNGPFNILLRSPDLGNRLQAVGEYLRFKTSLPHAINEFAIVTVAREWTAQYEFFAHKKLALVAGVKEDVVDDIAAGRTPKMTPDQQAVWTFIKELDSTHQVSDSTFDNVKQRFGERGVVDLVTLVGYYHTMSMLMNVDRYPMPPGEATPLQMLK
jgi:4-carboxymuconolactone decarboxylase